MYESSYAKIARIAAHFKRHLAGGGRGAIYPVMTQDGTTAASPGTLLCFGFGYTAEALAKRLLAEGWRVTGTTRSAARAKEIGKLGAEPLLLPDFSGAVLHTALRSASHVLSSVPPDENGDPVLQALGERLEEARQLSWIGYLSTTGVYGDRGGAWVDEDTPPAPGNPRSQRRLEAETAWLRLQRDHGLAVQVFRLAGIYGPGRSQIAALKAGRARRVVKPGQLFSRIHVADIAGALAASMRRPAPGRIYNLADDEPAATDEVVSYAARLLGIEPPPAIPFEQAELSEMARSFYAENRRVGNTRLRQELGLELAYPSYREGLAAELGDS